MDDFMQKFVNRIVLYWYLQRPGCLWQLSKTEVFNEIKPLYLSLNEEFSMPTWEDWAENQDWDAITSDLNWFAHEISRIQAESTFIPYLTKSAFDSEIAQATQKVARWLSKTFVFERN
jgi:hypothetical protein